MPQKSKKYLPQDLEKRIFATFAKFFSDHIASDPSGETLSEFLTPTEKTYLTKRFMIAYFLIKGVEHREISKILNVSLSTIGGVVTRLNSGEKLRKELANFFEKEKSQNTAEPISVLEALLTDPRKILYKEEKRRHEAEHSSTF